MPYYLEVPLDNGQTVLAEITSQVDEVVPAGAAGNIVGKLPEVFGAGLDKVQAFAGEALGRMRTLAEPPDVVSLEFGLSLSAKAGVVIAEATGTAHMKVSVEWHRHGEGLSSGTRDGSGDGRGG